MNFTSSLIENAVNEFSKLPGIGKRTALRLVLHFLQQPKEDVNQFSDVVKKMRATAGYYSQLVTIGNILLTIEPVAIFLKRQRHNGSVLSGKPATA